MSTARRTYAFVIAVLLCCGLLFSQTAHMARVSHAANLSPCTQQLVKLTVALPNQKATGSAIAVVLGAFALAAVFLLGVYGFGLHGVPAMALAALRRSAGLQRGAFAACTQRGLFTLRI